VPGRRGREPLKRRRRAPAPGLTARDAVQDRRNRDQSTPSPFVAANLRLVAFERDGGSCVE